MTASKYLVSTFLNDFMNYITWFNLNYPSPNQFNIENCSYIIFSKYNIVNDNTKFYNFHADFHDHFDKKISTFECPKCGFTLNKGDNFCINCGTKIEDTTIETKITNKINELKDKYLNVEVNSKEESINQDYNPNFNQEEILKNLNIQNEEIKIILEKLNETVEGIDEKLDTIINQLNHVQSHTEKLIKTAVTEEEIDRIIQVHTTQCVENILEFKNNIVKDENYDIEKAKLMEIFGYYSWKKLSSDSKTFLITSKFMYNHLSQINENFDYSSILLQKHWKLKFSKDFLQILSHILMKNTIKTITNITRHYCLNIHDHYIPKGLQWEVLHMYCAIERI